MWLRFLFVLVLLSWSGGAAAQFTLGSTPLGGQTTSPQPGDFSSLTLADVRSAPLLGTDQTGLVVPVTLGTNLSLSGNVLNAAGGGGGGTGTIGSGSGGQIAQYAPGIGTTLQPATVTGDFTIVQGGAGTLATVNSTAGTYATWTVNAKGLGTQGLNLSGDCTTSAAVITCTSINGVTLSALATATAGAGLNLSGGILSGISLPASGSMVVANGSLSPAGLAPTNGNLPYGVAGAWSSISLVSLLASPPGAIGSVGAVPITAASFTIDNIVGTTQCLHANTVGVVTGTGADCGSGGAGGLVGSAAGSLMVSPGATGTVAGLAPVNGSLVYGASGIWAVTSLASLLGSPPGPIGNATPVNITAASLTATGTITSNVTGGISQCIHASTSGILSGTGADCASTTTWPGAGNLVVSNSTNAPSSLAPVNGSLVYGVSGSWSAASLATLLASPPGPIGITAPVNITAAALTATGGLTTNITGSIQCLHASAIGVVSGTGSDCGAGGGGITGSAAGSVMVSPGVTGTATGLAPVNGSLVYGASGAWGVSSLSTLLAAQLAAPPGPIGSGTPVNVTAAAFTATGTVTTSITGATQCLHVSATGVISGAGLDCVTSFTLSPGLTSSTTGAYNTGIQTVGTGGNIALQQLNVSINSAGTQVVAASDVGHVFTPYVAGVVLSLPNPGAIGGPSFLFGYDGVHGYTVTTAGGTASIYGCGATGTTIYATGPVGLMTDAASTPGYMCFPWGGTPPTVPLISGATVAINAALGNVFTLLLGNSTVAMGSPTGLTDGKVIDIVVTQASGGGDAVTWNSIFKWPLGAAPTMTAAANAVDVYSCVYIAAVTKLNCQMAQDER